MPPPAPRPSPASSPAPFEPSRPSEWRDTTTPGELRGPFSTGFDTALLDQPALAVPAVFDVCHVGVVLRAVLFVNASVALGVLFAADGLGSWMTLATTGCAVALPGVMLWLIVACLMKRVFARWPIGAQAAAAITLGAASGALAWLLGASTALDLFAAPRWPAAALAGAALAGLVFGWLRMQARARLPVETTAKLAELQSRIRPHFLFNTLNTALSLVRFDPARAEGVLEDLAELFRVALADSGEAVTLAEEVELAQRYLAIEQIRFGARLIVHWEIDPAAGRARVPPLLLQPLLENAVRHGVEPAPEGGVIRVRTRVKLGRAVLSIVNSVPKEPSQPGAGIALRNVRERVRLMHDVAAQFETRRDAQVFRVQLVLPL